VAIFRSVVVKVTVTATLFAVFSIFLAVKFMADSATIGALGTALFSQRVIVGGTIAASLHSRIHLFQPFVLLP
jgi:hypothetical protein